MEHHCCPDHMFKWWHSPAERHLVLSESWIVFPKFHAFLSLTEITHPLPKHPLPLYHHSFNPAKPGTRKKGQEKGRHAGYDQTTESEFLTSVTPSNSLPNTSLLFSLALSMASSFTITASILETMLPMECSMRSTRLMSLRATRGASGTQTLPSHQSSGMSTHRADKDETPVLSKHTSGIPHTSPTIQEGQGTAQQESKMGKAHGEKKYICSHCS